MQPSENLLESVVDPSAGAPRTVLGGPAPQSEIAAQPRARLVGDPPALNLFEEHITDENTAIQYRRASHGGSLLNNWFVPDSWMGPDGANNNFVLKVQPFKKGGYEATVRSLDLEKIGAAIVSGKKRGKREAPSEISVENQMKASARAKREMRYKVRNMMADHLVTFSKRESDPEKFWTFEDWAAAWDRFRRSLNKIMPDFPYVAILEHHKKGNLHLHVAWCGRVNLGIVRKLWYIALGCKGNEKGADTPGGVCAKRMYVPAGHDRSSRIARYISKYVGKSFEENPRFNKKRYWASRQTLEEARRYVLTADTLDAAVNEMAILLGLDYMKFQEVCGGKFRNQNLFLFPGGGGMWLNYIPELHGGDPPF